MLPHGRYALKDKDINLEHCMYSIKQWHFKASKRYIEGSVRIDYHCDSTLSVVSR